MFKRLALICVLLLVLGLAAGCSGEQGTADTSGNEGQVGSQATEAKAEITQKAFHVWKDSIGTVWAHGAIEIKNTGDVPVKVGDISFSFTGTDGSILGTTTMLLPVPEIIKPGEVAYAGDSTIIEGVTDKSAVADMEANIDFDKTEEEAQILEVTDLKMIKGSFGDVKVTGRITNNTEENADDIRIIVAMLDADNKLVGIMTSSPTVTLAPGKNMGFEASYPVLDAGVVGNVKNLKGFAFNWTW
ncbi:MAG TPA: hypothetical protein GX691_03435 [Clostridia bacterium]|nr:hypothetical protein [Clostridia bacterium]